MALGLMLPSALCRSWPYVICVKVRLGGVKVVHVNVVCDNVVHVNAVCVNVTLGYCQGI